MNNPWKLATLALALTGVTALSTGLTTAYWLRPATPAEATVAAPAPLAYAPAPTAPRVVRPAVVAAVATPIEGAGSRAVATPAPAVRPVAIQTVADDCSTGGQRAM